MIKYVFIVLVLCLQSPWAAAAVDWFKDESGRTKWQHLANFSSASLIIILSITAIYLLIYSRRAHRANRELTTIKNELEQRVKERTAAVEESNRKLIQSNQLLESEVAQHVITANQLRSSELYVKDILTSMPLMLVGLNKDGQVTQWNKRVEELSGVPSEKALGKTLWEAYPTMTIVPEHIQQAIEQNKIIHLKQSLRSLSHFDITIYPLQGPEPGVVILVDDVSKETTAENLLIHNDKMSFMGELASSMAHDINIPLQAILMDLKRFKNIMADSQKAGDKTPLLESIYSDMSDKGDQVAKIIHNLLTFARNRNSEKQMADIVDVMEHTVNLGKEVISVSDGLMFNQVKLEWQVEKGLPQVPCYITELQQVFLSLFRHACAALQKKIGTEGFEPTIKIILSESYDNMWIKIQHNGVGLTSEEQMSLFEPFFSNTQPAEDFDTGEHLSFSYYIITEQHQGHMAVTSDPAVGSTFHMQIPITR
ncbi:ATP-binding protein [Amphritea sp. 2_MG-2023]|uniref:two-component system sensor histidine kinase NtrB n=1 Tax=Amphritea TaxID=515417 RepID=UPI001C073EC6|nr:MULTISPECIES: ATP-binding protein [Amphritea]MBU2966715.1 PAS domain-containing protein [Amphritea atlantica]MDO6417426.1 ATP-binding protein [Amphritea sp. 2_MG-2023]